MKATAVLGAALLLTFVAAGVRASARGSFKRSACGMRQGVDNNRVGDEVAPILEFEARRK